MDLLCIATGEEGFAAHVHEEAKIGTDENGFNHIHFLFQNFRTLCWQNQFSFAVVQKLFRFVRRTNAE